ncbi:macro domain-containing protein [Paludisphaera soli]|uniref:macro domain-containing protein n=1 Tax=Paludisphaera soli TaxID=2712865 RepID=UPI001981F3BF|nr:macro domain-containing protein [Paludisphaera soli]
MLEALRARARRLRMKTIKPFGRGRGGAPVRLHFCDANPQVAAALAGRFRDVDTAEVLVGDLLDLRCDALLSPANSFGDMGGGLDKRIDDFHGGAAQREVTRRIAERRHGELPVGSAEILAMPSRRFPWLVVAPTMRVPGRVDRTLNAYLAFRAALIAVLEHDPGDGARISGLACSGLGTGVGGMSGEDAAAQMRAAYDMIIERRWRRLVHPMQAPFAVSDQYPGPAGEI